MKQPLKFSQFGADNGRLIIYFHGAPGGLNELRPFNLYGEEHKLTFVCFDRFSIDTSLKGEVYYQFLAKEILTYAAGRKIDIIGFSIGAFIALQTCRYLNNEVMNLHLVSAAAPLDAGDFIDAMAGKHVFQLAKKFPSFFILLSYWQGLLALVFPNALFYLLFASATGKDKMLMRNQEFKFNITQMLKSCFTNYIKGYTRDIKAYVRPWKATLSEISVNTHIWHGEKDNWSPVIMAEYLHSSISSCSHIEILHDLSHYSCLYETIPKIYRPSL